MKAWGPVSGDITAKEIVYGIWPVSRALALDNTLGPLCIFQIVVLAERNCLV